MRSEYGVTYGSGETALLTRERARLASQLPRERGLPPQRQFASFVQDERTSSNVRQGLDDEGSLARPDALFQRLAGISGEHRNLALPHDGSGIELTIDEMNGHARLGFPGFDDRFENAVSMHASRTL